MAVSKIKCDEWYVDGDEINVSGTWLALSGQAQPYNAGFTIPGKKRIPSNATITLKNLNINWLRTTNASLTPIFKNAYVSGDSIIIEVKANAMASLTFYCVHFSDGIAVIHTS